MTVPIFSSPEHKCLENYWHNPDVVIVVVVVVHRKIFNLMTHTNWQLLLKLGCRQWTTFSDGKEVKDVFGRPGACVEVGSAR